MKKALLLLILLPNIVFAQEFNTQNWSVESSLMLESRDLDRDFFLDFYTGQFLDSSLKRNALSNLNSESNLGYYSLNSFSYYAIKEEKSIGLYADLSYQKILGSNISKRSAFFMS